MFLVIGVPEYRRFCRITQKKYKINLRFPRIFHLRQAQTCVDMVPLRGKNIERSFLASLLRERARAIKRVAVVTSHKCSEYLTSGGLRVIYPPSKSGIAEPCLAEIIFVPGFVIPRDESWDIIRCGRSSLWPQSLQKSPQFQQTRLWMFEYEYPSRMLGLSGMGLDELAGNLTYWLGIELEKKGHVRDGMHSVN